MPMLITMTEDDGRVNYVRHPIVEGHKDFLMKAGWVDDPARATLIFDREDAQRVIRALAKHDKRADRPVRAYAIVEQEG